MFWFIISFILLFFCLLYSTIDTSNERKQIHNLIRHYTKQIIKWSYISKQDSNPKVKLVHSNYAYIFLIVLKDHLQQFKISNDQLYNISGKYLEDLEKLV